MSSPASAHDPDGRAPIVDELRVAPGDWPAAVALTEGPQLVVAGPGTGKTDFLVARAGHLVAAGIARPEEILVLSFSRRSASDIRHRLSLELGGTRTPISCSTFHSFASRLLETHGTDVIGWRAMPTLLTGPEQVQLVSELLATEDPERWPERFRRLLGSRTFAADVTDFLLRCRERRLGSADIDARTDDHPEWSALPAFMDRYHGELSARGRIDYGTLLDTAITVVEDPGVLDSLTARHRYVLVDEYQDTSPAQAALLEALHAATPNLTVTGDPYQSIYSFRGASLHNVDEFPFRFRRADGEPARRIVLTTSFRVPAQILDGALAVTSGGSLPGAAGPVVPAPHHGSVEAHVFDQTSAEADWIASEIERIHLSGGVPYSEIAVLLRTKRHLVRELSRALSRRSIPHDPPDQRLVDHPAVQIVRDVVLAAALSDPSAPPTWELDAAMRRLLLGPLVGLGLATEREVARERIRSERRWPELLSAEIEGTDRLAELIDAGDWAVDLPAVDGFWHLWDRLDLVEPLVLDDDRADFRSAWTAFSQALERQSERDSSISLLDYFRLADSDDFEAEPLLSHRRSAEDRLTLTTLHQSKGLEFEVVFIADAADSVFPDLRRGISLLPTRGLDPHTGSDHASHLRFRLQEEMRLAYTAMTRARRRVVWTATSAGIDESERRPSRFMVTATGRSEVGELGPPPASPEPITLVGAQAHLRRIAADPGQAPARRLAAIHVLVDTEHWDPAGFAGVQAPGPDTGVMPERFSLSPSQAEAYDTCPRRYVLERRLGIGDASSPYLQYGALVHLVLERAEASAADDGRARSTLEDALDELDEVWAERADFGSPNHTERWRLKAHRLLEKMYAEWPTASGRPVALEHELRLELDGMTWRGFADRIEDRGDGALTVVDYKTGTRLPTLADAAESIQLGFYLLAARHDDRLDGDVVGAEMWCPAARQKTWIRAFDPDRLDDLTDRLRTIGAAIESEIWDPTPGAACGSCAVKVVCPVQPEGREAYQP